ncbi:MAG: cupredoxin domain-containing protein [Thermomicrobiales bacterium]|nr:cupredoxin domain-containing protein [Thermomicrobiales bacterium]
MAIALALVVLTFGSGVMRASAQSSTATPTKPEPCPAATPVSGQTTPALCVVIGEYDMYFNPNLITIPADTPVRIVLINHGSAEHNFQISDHENSGLKNLNVNVTTDPGKTGEVTINAPAGTYYFFCDQPGHEAAGMRGYLTVTKDAKIGTAYEKSVPERAS